MATQEYRFAAKQIDAPQAVLHGHDFWAINQESGGVEDEWIGRILAFVTGMVDQELPAGTNIWPPKIGS
jgi:hypothetical protein